MAAWLHIRAVRDPDRFDAWLNRLLVHACYREARRARRREVVEIHIDAPEARGHRDAQDLTAVRDQLERGFRRLTPEQRAVLVVHHYLGLPDPEAAIVLDLAARHVQVATAPSLRRPSRGPRSRRTDADPSPRSPSHDRPRRLRPNARRLVRRRRALAGARRWSRPGPRRHAPPPAPAGVARRSRAAAGSGRRPMPVRAPRAAGRALTMTLVGRARPAAWHRGPRRRGDPGRSPTAPALTATDRSSRPPCLRPRRRHLRGRLGRQELGPDRGRPTRRRRGPHCGVFEGPDVVARRAASRLPIRLERQPAAGERLHHVIAAGSTVASFPGTGWRVAWSPDSTRVATWVDLEQDDRHLWRSTACARHCIGACRPGPWLVGDDEPYWSRDGTSLLLRLRHDPRGERSSRIWELPVDGRTPRGPAGRRHSAAGSRVFAGRVPLRNHE